MGCNALSASRYICVRSCALRPKVRVMKRARLPGPLVMASSVVKSVRLETRKVLEVWGWMDAVITYVAYYLHGKI